MTIGHRVKNLYLRVLAGHLRRTLQRSWTPLTAPRHDFPRLKERPVVRIAAAQFSLDAVPEPSLWHKRLHAIFQSAAQARADILVFPEDMSLPLLGIIARWLPRSPGPPDPSQTALALATLAPIAYDHWQRVMQDMARHFAIITVAGSGLTVRNQRLVNQALIISDQGHIMAEQPKMHLFAFEQDWGVTAGSLVNQTANSWSLYTVVCNDATYFETFRMLRHRGADLIAVPIADPEPHYSEHKARRGTWARVQETPVCGIVGAGTGSLFGFTLSGKAGIYLPAALTPDHTGIVAESSSAYGEGIVMADVDLDALHEYQKSQPKLPKGPWQHPF